MEIVLAGGGDCQGQRMPGAYTPQGYSPIMSLSDEIGTALAAATLKPEDGATRALAVQYAVLIDEAAPAGKYGKALAWLAGEIEVEADQRDRCVEIIRIALAEHTVASDLGPKLLAALEALGMSPRARAAQQKGTKTGDRRTPTRLDELRAARERKHATPPRDAATP